MGDFPAAAGRLPIARKTKLDKGSVNFGHCELINNRSSAIFADVDYFSWSD
jgi:hypothetical protein